MRVLPLSTEPCLCRSDRNFGHCCESTVKQIREQLRGLCPDVVDFPHGGELISLTSILAGLRPSPMGDRTAELAQALHRVVNAIDNDPDDYTQLREHVASFVTAKPGLRLVLPENSSIDDEKINAAVDSRYRSTFWWYLYTLYRLFVDDPARLASCALATLDVVLNDPPAKTLIWTTVLRATDEVLYRDFVDSNFDEPGTTNTRWVIQAVMHGHIKLQIPLYAVAYGATSVKESVPETSLKEYMAIRTAADIPGNRAEAARLVDAIDRKVLGQIGDCLANAFNVEGPHFVPAFVEALANWFYDAGFPRSLWNVEMLQQVYQLLTILRNFDSEETPRLALLLYIDAVTRFIHTGGLDELMNNREALTDEASDAALHHPAIAAHLEHVYSGLAALRP